MTLHINISELDEDMRKLYLEDKVTNLSIDYMYNAIMGWVGTVEVKLFSFDNFFKSDNRYNSYNLYKNKSEIVVEFISTRKNKN